MPIDPKKLMALVEEQQGGASAPMPPPWGVLLADPNPDGSRKSCGNCMMWAHSNQCNIYDPGLEITADQICGYHVFGEPMEEVMEHPGIQYQSPEYGGLESVPGGTSCDICKYYEAEEDRGLCHAVADPESGSPPTPVLALQCCARWEGMEGPES